MTGLFPSMRRNSSDREEKGSRSMELVLLRGDDAEKKSSTNDLGGETTGSKQSALGLLEKKGGRGDGRLLEGRRSEEGPGGHFRDEDDDVGERRANFHWM